MFRKNKKQAYIKCKTYYNKKPNASKSKKHDYVYVVQPKAEHQGRNLFSTDFRWNAPYIDEEALRTTTTWYEG